MRRFISTFFICLGCLSSMAGTLTQDFFDHQNIERNAWVYVPDNYDGSKAYPLVFAAHGLGNSAEVMIGIVTFEELAEADSFIIVWPEGKYTGAIFGHAWNVGLGFNGGVDDVGFIDLLIDYYSANYNIDPARIFMSGFSQGGSLGYLYACERPGVLRAIASSAGPMSNQIFDDCNNAVPTPVLHIHGTLDPIIFYNGLLTSYKSTAQALAFWRNVNNCGDEPVITYLPNIHPDGYTVTLFEYNSCADPEKEVIHYKLVGGFHTWPGSNNDIDGNVKIWEFFKHQGQDIISSSQNELNKRLQVYPNPTSDHLIVDFNFGAKSTITLYNSSGELVMNRFDVNGNSVMDVRMLVPGIYLMQVTVNAQTLSRRIAINN